MIITSANFNVVPSPGPTKPFCIEFCDFENKVLVFHNISLSLGGDIFVSISMLWDFNLKGAKMGKQGNQVKKTLLFAPHTPGLLLPNGLNSEQWTVNSEQWTVNSAACLLSVSSAPSQTSSMDEWWGVCRWWDKCTLKYWVCAAGQVLSV